MHTKSTGYKIFLTINTVFMALICIICLYPFLYMLFLSISDVKAVIAGKVLFYPIGFDLNAYKVIMTYPNFFISYWNTIFYTVAGTAIALLMTITFAYPLSKPYLKGREFLMDMVIFTMFPFAIGPFNLIILTNFFKTLPESIEEAARIDGMSFFGILTKIVLPLSKPAIATITLFVAVFFWNDWFYGMIYMSSSNRYPVMLILRNIVSGNSIIGAAAGSGDADTVVYSTLKSATSILTILPIMALYPFLQRYFITGLTLGSVKG